MLTPILIIVSVAAYQGAALAETKTSYSTETVGPNLDKLVCVDDFYQAAKAKLSPIQDGVWDYLSGGSDDLFVLEQSRKAFQKYAVRPRMLRDVTERNLSTTILGKNVPFPIGIAPMALQKLVHPQGEAGTARGAGIAGAIFILSTMASTTIEEVAASAPNTRLWFQLYFQNDRDLTAELINRAEKAGYETLVLTLDTQLIGKRRADLRNPLKLPKHVTYANFDDDEDSDLSQAEEDDSFNSLRNNSNPVRDIGLEWDVIDWIRERTKMKLVLKGILTEEDAKLAVSKGVDGIIVSNHGGRQLDCVLPTIDALSEVVAAVAGSSIEVYMDGGISLGSDVFKALALGAKMVFVGRGALTGLAVAGENGVAKVMEIYRSELDLTMGLSGVSKVADINAKFIQRYSPL